MIASTCLVRSGSGNGPACQRSDVTPEQVMNGRRPRRAAPQWCGARSRAALRRALAPCWRYRMSGVSPGDDRPAIRRHDNIRPPIVPRSLRHLSGIDQFGRRAVQHHAATRRQILRQRGGKSRRTARHQHLGPICRRAASTGVRAQKYNAGRPEAAQQAPSRHAPAYPAARHRPDLKTRKMPPVPPAPGGAARGNSRSPPSGRPPSGQRTARARRPVAKRLIAERVPCPTNHHRASTAASRHAFAP